MNLSDDYPFNPPIWSLYSIDYKCNKDNLNILDYYTYLIKNHNDESQRQWSPAIKFEQECLRLIVRLNHFHYLFQ